jgi:hypothetical protein
LSVKEPPVLATVDTRIMAKGAEFVFDGNANIDATAQDIICTTGSRYNLGRVRSSDWLIDCSIGTGNKNLLGKELSIEYSMEKELWDNEDTTSITLTFRDNDTEGF